MHILSITTIINISYQILKDEIIIFFQCLESIFKLKDWDVVVNLGSMLLSDTFRDPNNVTTFLFFQFQIGIKNAKVKLLHECINIQFDFILKKLVLQCLFTWISSCAFKALLIILVIFSDSSDLIIVISSCQS